MGIDAHEERARDALGAAIVANRLGRGEDVGFVEALAERGASVTGGPEAHTLRRLGRVGTFVEVSPEKRVDVDQHLRRRGLPSKRMRIHRWQV